MRFTYYFIRPDGKVISGYTWVEIPFPFFRILLDVFTDQITGIPPPFELVEGIMEGIKVILALNSDMAEELIDNIKVQLRKIEKEESN